MDNGTKEILMVALIVPGVAALAGLGLLIRHYIGQGGALTDHRHRVAMHRWFVVVALLGGIGMVVGFWLLRGELNRTILLWVALGACVSVLVALLVTVTSAGDGQDR